MTFGGLRGPPPKHTICNSQRRRPVSITPRHRRARQGAHTFLISIPVTAHARLVRGFIPYEWPAPSVTRQTRPSLLSTGMRQDMNHHNPIALRHDAPHPGAGRDTPHNCSLAESQHNRPSRPLTQIELENPISSLPSPHWGGRGRLPIRGWPRRGPPRCRRPTARRPPTRGRAVTRSGKSSP